MIVFNDYNFCMDGNCLDPMPTNLHDVTSTTVENCIVDDVYITKDIDSPYITEKVTEWDLDTILFANFEGSIKGGKIDALLQDITSVKIKRRKKGSFDWVTIKEFPIQTEQDLNLLFNDYSAQTDIIYEYAWVPSFSGTEGEYIVTEVLSKFNGVFIADADTIFKFFADVEYSNTAQVQRVGSFEPFGRKYPVYVANGNINYRKGTVTGRIIGDYMNTRVFDRYYIKEELDRLLDFLCNHRVKVLKDWNGNDYLMVITGTPSVYYDDKSGMSMMSVQFDWSEAGDVNNEKDMINSGLVLEG